MTSTRIAARAAIVVAIAMAGSGIAVAATHPDRALDASVTAEPPGPGDPATSSDHGATSTTTAGASTTSATTGPVNEMARRPPDEPHTGSPGGAAATAAPAPGAARVAPAPASRTTPAAATAAPDGVAPVADEAPAAPPAEQHCLVTLHGKGGAGSAPRTSGAVLELAPTGNAPGWGGRQWRYEDAASFAQARGVVRSAVDDAGCTRVIVHGFSNGAAFAAKLYCRGESLGGRLVRVIVDDPVTDAGVVGCAPAGGVAVTLYWTGALAAQAPAGWSCAAADWTCEGGTSIGIDAYAAALHTTPRPSPMGAHAMFTAAPERTRF